MITWVCHAAKEEDKSEPNYSAPRHKPPNFLALTHNLCIFWHMCTPKIPIYSAYGTFSKYLFVALFECCFNRVSNLPIHFLKLLWAVTSLMILMRSHIHDNASAIFCCHCLVSVFHVSFFILWGPAMPPKSKRVRQSSAAATQGREALDQTWRSKAVRLYLPLWLAGDMHAKVVPISVASSSSATEVVADPKILPDFVEEWVQTFDWGYEGPGHALCSTLVNEFSFTQTRAAQFAVKIVNKPDRTVCQWRTDLIRKQQWYIPWKQTLPTYVVEFCGQMKSFVKRQWSMWEQTLQWREHWIWTQWISASESTKHCFTILHWSLDSLAKSL